MLLCKTKSSEEKAQVHYRIISWSKPGLKRFPNYIAFSNKTIDSKHNYAICFQNQQLFNNISIKCEDVTLGHYCIALQK